MSNTHKIENLQPFKDTHSISEVILSVYLASPIFDPGRFGDLVKEGGLLADKFQSFGLIKGVQVDFKMQQADIQASMQTDVSNTGKDGFNFQCFKDGKLAWNIHYQPTPLPQAGQDLLSIHCMDYDGWSSFLNESLRLIKILGDFADLYIAGYSLYYLDQFNWKGGKLPDMENIFNSKSQYLPSLLFQTSGVWNFSSNTSRNIDNRLVTETTTIGVNQIEVNTYNIYLFHHAASMFNEFKTLKQLAEAAEFKTLANKMHELNKDFLKQTLDTEVQKKIGLQ